MSPMFYQDKRKTSLKQHERQSMVFLLNLLRILWTILPGTVRVESVKNCILDRWVMDGQFRVNHNQIMTEQGKHGRWQSPHLQHRSFHVITFTVCRSLLNPFRNPLKKWITTDPDERVLGVTNGGESTEIEYEDKLCSLWAELQLAEGWVLYMGTCSRQTQKTQQTVQSTSHLSQNTFISCLQDGDVLQTQHSMIYTMCCCHHL